MKKFLIGLIGFVVCLGIIFFFVTISYVYKYKDGDFTYEIIPEKTSIHLNEEIIVKVRWTNNSGKNIRHYKLKSNCYGLGRLPSEIPIKEGFIITEEGYGFKLNRPTWKSGKVLEFDITFQIDEESFYSMVEMHESQLGHPFDVSEWKFYAELVFITGFSWNNRITFVRTEPVNITVITV